MRTTPPKSPRCSPTCANSNASSNWPCCWFITPARTPTSTRPGQALRGSSELHGWGDSNLYLRRKGSQLTLSTEHRAAPSRDHIPLQLAQSGSAVALTVVDRSRVAAGGRHPPRLERVRQALAQLQRTASRFSSCTNSAACAPPPSAPPWPNSPPKAKSSATPAATNSNSRCPFPAL